MDELLIKKLGPLDINSLKDFFFIISNSTIPQTFHPHLFNDQMASIICNEQKDLYCSIFINNKIVGYGMLRGYAEGYSIPSLGVCIHPGYSNLKLGQLLIHYLHSQAQLLGSNKVRLKVYKTNYQAIHIYTKLGYILEEFNSNELLGFKNL